MEDKNEIFIEKEVLEALQTKYKNVIYQYKPSLLHGKTSAQSIDFFLPDYNIGIEYHGRQHFIPIPKFGVMRASKKQKKEIIENTKMSRKWFNHILFNF